jgi:hypothetical protein
MDVLERKILEAHAEGDASRLANLQKQYRSEVARGLRSVTRVGPPPQVADRRTRSSTGYRSTSQFTVVGISRETRRSLGNYAGDGLEDGGWLYGYFGSTAIMVDRASGPGPWPDRTSSSVRLDSDYARDMLDVYGPVCGDWHSHGPGGSPQPSEQDKRSWAGLLDRFNLPAFAGIILEEGGIHGYPHAFITYKKDGRAVTVAAQLVEEEF